MAEVADDRAKKATLFGTNLCSDKVKIYEIYFGVDTVGTFDEPYHFWVIVDKDWYPSSLSRKYLQEFEI